MALSAIYLRELMFRYYWVHLGPNVLNHITRNKSTLLYDKERKKWGKSTKVSS
jgi:hypothetical protein